MSRRPVVGLMKIGKSVCFDPQSWKPIGADIEVYQTARVLSTVCERVHYWGAYSFGKGRPKRPSSAADVDVQDNVVFLPDQRDFTDASRHERLLDQVREADVDALVVVNGPHSTKNRTMAMFERYAWPTFKIVNEVRVPWLYLFSDWRYYLHARELARSPQKILTHYPIASQTKLIQGKRLEMRYTQFPVWGFWRIGQTKRDWPLEGRTWDLRMVGNEKPGYWDEWTKKYLGPVSSSLEKWEVWGSWPSAPEGDPRHRTTGTSLSVASAVEDLAGTRHFLVMVTPQGGAGYPITQRWWELAGLDGIVWVNEHYDAYHELVPADHFTRVRSGEELVAKIARVDEDPSLRDALVAEQRARFSPEHEGLGFLAGAFERELASVVADPAQEAFDSSELSPTFAQSFSEIDRDVEEVRRWTVSFGAAGPKAVRSTASNRALALLRGAAVAGVERFSFGELCALMVRDPFYEAKNSGEVERIAAHTMCLLRVQGLETIEDDETPRPEMPYDRAIEATPPCSARMMKRARRAAEKRTKAMTTAAAEGATTGRERSEAAPEEKRPRRNGTVPMENRFIVATTTVNPYREGTNTHAHFGIVCAAGPLGIWWRDLAAKIVETNTQGVQTGERLAAWQFKEFSKKGIARVFYRDGDAVLPFREDEPPGAVEGTVRRRRRANVGDGRIVSQVFDRAGLVESLRSGRPVMFAVWAGEDGEVLPFLPTEQRLEGSSWEDVLTALTEARPRARELPVAWVHVKSPRVPIVKAVRDVAEAVGKRKFAVSGLEEAFGAENTEVFAGAVERFAKRAREAPIEAYFDDADAADELRVYETVESDGTKMAVFAAAEWDAWDCSDAVVKKFSEKVWSGGNAVAARDVGRLAELLAAFGEKP